VNVKIHYDISTNEQLVFIWEDWPSGRQYFTFDDAGLVAHLVESRGRMEPAIRCSDLSVLRELARAISDVVPVDHATQAHLKDAVATRYRLLSLVEKLS